MASRIFEQVNTGKIPETTTKQINTHKVGFDTGQIIPVYVGEVLPGDTIKMNSTMVLRGSTPLNPTMDMAKVDIHGFFVPNRLVYKEGEKFITQGAEPEDGEEPFNGTVPYMVLAEGKYGATGTPEAKELAPRGTLGYLFNFIKPTGKLNAMYGRALNLIWNEGFRDQNFQKSIYIETTGGQILDEEIERLDKPLKANKYHDYFTSALPKPQKGAEVIIPVGGKAPIKDLENIILRLYPTFGLETTGPIVVGNDDVISPSVPLQLSELKGATGATLDIKGGMVIKREDDETNNHTIEMATKQSYADLSEATGISINELRRSIVVQHFMENEARGGGRYIESILSHWGVISPDSRLQRPEYLGGRSQPININQVVQTAGNSTDNPNTGGTGAYSQTNSNGHDFKMYAQEHGMIFGLAVVRTEHTYSQGIEAMFGKGQNKFDYYFPELIGISEQPIYKREIGAQNSGTNEVGGYKQPGAEYLYKPNSIHFPTMMEDSMDTGSYADKYEEKPTLSAEGLEETTVNVDRTLAVQSKLAVQGFSDGAFGTEITRKIPFNLNPGIDKI